MLKYRVLTALILFSLILLAIWFLSASWFSVLIGGIILWAAWEWSALSGIKNKYIRGFYVALIGVALSAACYLSIFWVLIASLIIWLWVAVAILCYALNLTPLGFQYLLLKIIFGFFALIFCWLTINALRENIGGPSWLLFGLMLIWAMDTGAYAVGRFWGRHTLIARVSPNKTWEGLVGGIVLTLLVAIIRGVFFRFSLYQLSLLVLLAIVTGFFAVVGDLFESMLKRQAGIKDSGRLLPGHGGMLDRIDSLIVALPIFALGSLLTLSVKITLTS